MSFVNLQESFNEFAVPNGIFRLDWVSETGVGFKFGEYGTLPRSVPTSFEITAFKIRGYLALAYPCVPGRYCHVLATLPEDDFSALGGAMMLKDLFQTIGLDEKVPYVIRLLDKHGLQDIEGRASVIMD